MAKKKKAPAAPSLIEMAAKMYLERRTYFSPGTENTTPRELVAAWKILRNTDSFSNYNEEGWNYCQFDEFQKAYGDLSSAMNCMAEFFDDYLVEIA